MKCRIAFDSIFSAHLLTTDAINEEDEGPKIKERLLALSLKYLDVCCVWDCSPYWVSFQRLISLFVYDAFIELFITLCIVVNTLFMALDHHGMNEEMSRALKMGNYVKLLFHFFVSNYFWTEIYLFTNGSFSQLRSRLKLHLN